jgi:hypothetical protein
MWSRWLAGVLGVYIVTLLLIRPEDYSDTFNYAKHLVDQRYHPPLAQTNPFWDFGHVLWRPMGYVVWRCFGGPLATLCGGDRLLAAGVALIALSIVAGLAGVVYMFLFAANTTRSPFVAAITTIGYLSTNAILHYQLTGMSYVAGLACQIAGLYYLHCSIAEGRLTLFRGAVSGLLFALSVVIWFPYALSALGVSCYAACVRESEEGPGIRQRSSLLAGLAGGTAAVVMLVYGCALLAGHHTSIESVSQWIAQSRYDKLPNRGILRMLGSVPRGFLSLGSEPTEWKRMFFEHRLLSLGGLLRSGIWKVAWVYLTLTVSVFVLGRSSWGRRHLVCLLATVVPLAIFAAFLFEATPPERYMPAFPLLFLGFSWIMADPRSGRTAKGILPLFFASALAVNLTALSRFSEPADLETGRMRVQALNGRVSPNDWILIQSYQDPVMVFVNARPFSPLSKNRFLFYVAVPWGSAHPELWPRHLAGRVHAAWENGGQAWITDRFLANAPDPAWEWVEGDDPRIRWADFHAFVEKLDLGNAFGGTDGFSEILRTNRNQALLDAAFSLAIPRN